VKSPVFPWSKFPGVDTVLGPEMRSTGEVMASPTISRSFCGHLCVCGLVADTGVSQGTVTTSTGTLDLASANGTASGKLAVTAEGGPVSDYSITVGPTLAGRLTCHPRRGRLPPGRA